MIIPLRANKNNFHVLCAAFKKKGLSISRLAEDVLYVKSCGKKCCIHFKDGEIIEYSYRLNIFQKKFDSLMLFVRVHRYYLIKLDEVIGYAWHQAKLSNNEIIQLNAAGYVRVKKFVDEKNKGVSSSAA
jgi:DNA-binding LytR/AlgR family response regulator